MPGMDLGIDLGTSQTVICIPGRGIVLREPSVIAVDSGDGHIVACGKEAYEMLGRTPDAVTASTTERCSTSVTDAGRLTAARGLKTLKAQTRRTKVWQSSSA